MSPAEVCDSGPAALSLAGVKVSIAAWIVCNTVWDANPERKPSATDPLFEPGSKRE